MSHATEGELQMALDGALDLLPDGRGEQVRGHLAVCDDCARRLEEERAVRERAAEILGGAPKVELPSLADLREQAGRMSAPSTSSGVSGRVGGDRGMPRGVGLAWAATVVLALGIGYLGARATGGPALAPGFGDRSRGSADAGAAGAEAVATSVDEAPVAAPVGIPADARNPRSGPVGQDDEAPSVSPQGGSPGLRESREETRPAAGRGAAEQDRAVGTVRDEPVPASARVPERLLADVGEQRVAGAAPDEDVAQEAPAAVPMDVLRGGLPLPLLEVEVPGQGAAGLRLVYGLATGDTLVVRYLSAGNPMAGEISSVPTDRVDSPGVRVLGQVARQESPAVRLDAASPAKEAEGVDSLSMLRRSRSAGEVIAAPASGAVGGGNVATRRIGAWLVEIRAPLPADSLEALLDLLAAPSGR